MKANDLLPVISKRLAYDSAAGTLRWLYSPSHSASWNAKHAGKPAGNPDTHGYMKISLRVDGRCRNVLLHRVAYYMAHGAVPCGEIDHINGDRSDNRIANLRDVSKSENQKNSRMRKDNKSGICGVMFDKQTGKWVAYASTEKRRRCLGYFQDMAAAEMATRSFRAQNGFTERHGRAA